MHRGGGTTATAKSPFTKWLSWTLLSLSLSLSLSFTLSLSLPHTHTHTHSRIGPLFFFIPPSVAHMVNTLLAVALIVRRKY